MVTNMPANEEILVQTLGQEIPWRRKCQPTPVFLPGKFHGQRSLVGCGPWVTELDTTELYYSYNSRSDASRHRDSILIT